MEDKAKVVVFTTPWCNICHSMMDWMTKTGIQFEERNLEDESVKEDIMGRMEGQFPGAPIVEIGEDIIQGFDRPKILSTLEKYGLKN